MSKIIAIAAVTVDGILAIDGKMPWNVAEDLDRFKRFTINNTIIMGRKTWESIGKKCLSNRINFVISKKPSWALVQDTCATYFTHIDYAINESQLKYPDKDIYIIGGASIYSQTLPICDELELTIIKESEVNRKGKSKLYLKEYPTIINTLFKLENKVETDYAIYKSYKRRAGSYSYKERAIL